MRPTCSRCRLPMRTCLCKILPESPSELDSLLHVVILQNPKEEKRNPFNSLRLLPFCVSQSNWTWIKRKKLPNWDFLEDETLKNRLIDGTGVYVLYPWRGQRTTIAEHRSTLISSKLPPILIVIDGTWDSARRIHCSAPVLHHLNHITLLDDGQHPPSVYAQLKKEPKDSYMCTIEAIAACFKEISWTIEESKSSKILQSSADSMLNCLRRWISQQLDIEVECKAAHI